MFVISQGLRGGVWVVGALVLSVINGRKWSLTALEFFNLN